MGQQVNAASVEWNPTTERLRELTEKMPNATVTDFGNVNVKAVAEAHKKDLAVQKKYGVNLINYWVDEKNGTVMCLAQAPDSAALINTHKEAHGLIPVSVMLVKQGQ